MSSKVNSQIKQIQREYVALIERHFKEEAEEYLKLDPDKQGSDEFIKYVSSKTYKRILVPSSSGNFVSGLYYKVESFRRDVVDFWKVNESKLRNCLADFHAVNVGLWPDLDVEDLIPKYALHFDTIFVPDSIPFYSGEQEGDAKSRVLPMIPFILRLRNVILADTDIPMIIIFPLRYGTKDGNEPLRKSTQSLACLIGSTLLRLKSHALDVEHLYDLVKEKGIGLINKDMDTEKIMSFLRPVQGLLTANLLPLTSQNRNLNRDELNQTLQRIVKRNINLDDIPLIMWLTHSMVYILSSREANSELFNFEFTPSPHLWSANFVRQDVVKNILSSNTILSPDQLVSYAFQMRFDWLSKISLTDAIKLREDGCLEDMREILRLENRNLKLSSYDNLERVSENYETRVLEVIDEQVSAFKSRQHQLKTKLGLSALSFGGTLILGSAGFLFPMPEVTIPTALFSALYGSKSLKDFSSTLRGINKERKQPDNGAMALLVNAQKS